jgi:NAD(P)-dependent dehydrogenase (short-subunit alcohol dehydrogenase family)
MEPNGHLAGKIILVTGATSGIGYITARELSRQGAQVILVGRDPLRTGSAVDSIRSETGNSQVSSMLADLASQAEIRRLAEQFNRQYPHLDVLVNNAGGFFLRRRVSPDGLEMTFALNHLAYFLLTLLLLPALEAASREAAGNARIVNVASDAHESGKINFNDLQSEHRYFSWAAYGQSKLANVLFTYELARRLGDRRVTANVLHPGFVSTNFAHNNGILAKAALTLMRFSMLSPEEGAQTSIYLASSLEVQGVTGEYFVRRQARPSAPASYDLATASRLWQVSSELTGIDFPGG